MFNYSFYDFFMILVHLQEKTQFAMEKVQASYVVHF